MTITVKHSKVSTVPDTSDTSLVRPSDWNADHTFTGTLDIVNGGTGASTASGALTNLGAATAAQGAKADTAIQTVTSADGSIVVIQAGTNIDLAVSYASPASTLVIYVRNQTGATLTKGTVVYINGATGQIPTVAKAQANAESTSAQTQGLITADIANNGFGYVTAFGLVNDIDTSAYTDGQQLYLSGTVAGAFTGTKPSAPTHLVYVGVVDYAHAVHGKIQVKVQNGYELEELHNVAISSPSNGQTILYDASTSLWKNANLTAGTGISVSNGAASATITNTAPDQTVAITSGTGISVTGTYPNFTVTNTAPSSGGTVTSVSGTTGRITSTGGTTPVIDLASGIATPGTTGSALLIPVITVDTYGRVTSITTAANPQGTVTSVGATGGTGISVTGSPITSSGSLTITNTGVTSIAGTASQITASASTGGVTLALTNPINVDTSGNAATVTNGVYTTGSYANPSWITSLAGSKISGTIDGGSF